MIESTKPLAQVSLFNPGMGIVLAALFGFSGVLLGAFGAHALSSRFGEYEKGIWQTAVFYQLVHALVLLAGSILGLWITHLDTRSGELVREIHSLWKWSLIFFSSGILLFSGSLYTLALSGVRAWGAVTPLGGTAFLVGWAIFIRAGWILRGLTS